MLIYLYGADTARSRHYLREQVVKFKAARDPQGYNVVFVDAQKESPGKIMGELLAAPFLAARRLIVLENLLNHADTEFLTQFGERSRADTWPKSNVIILWQGQAIGKTKVVKALHEQLSGAQYAEEFAPLTAAQLPVWITTYLKTRARTITPGALNYLVQQAEKDSRSLESVLDQLVAYSRDPVVPITAEMAELFLPEKKEDTIFNVVDAILSGNHKQARTLLNEARVSGLEDGYLFAMVTKQLHNLLLIRDCFDHASPFASDLAAKELGLHPFVVKKSLPLVKRTPLAQLKALQMKLLEVDHRLKTGAGSLPTLIDVLVGYVQ